MIRLDIEKFQNFMFDISIFDNLRKNHENNQNVFPDFYEYDFRVFCNNGYFCKKIKKSYKRWISSNIMYRFSLKNDNFGLKWKFWNFSEFSPVINGPWARQKHKIDSWTFWSVEPWLFPWPSQTNPKPTFGCSFENIPKNIIQNE